MSQEEQIVGATIAGKYSVRRVVGAGSMGVVCEAVHLEIGKRVAIKTIDASLVGMGDIAMRFRQEARTASLIESQHIVQVFDVGEDEHFGLYLVMEYLTGEDLAKTLAREGRLAPDVALRIAAQAARGLGKAHEAGVVHRDLKPANIFLVEREDEEALVKILDFGISKVVEATRGGGSGLRLTRAGMVVGTPQYMSPEQAQGHSVDARTDVWALGLVLYEMLSGRPGYPELPTYEQFILHLVSHSPDPLSEVAPWVPEDVARVVHEALAHDVAERIPTCSELLQRLTRVLSPRPRRHAPKEADSADTWTDVPATVSRPGQAQGVRRGGRNDAARSSSAPADERGEPPGAATGERDPSPEAERLAPAGEEPSGDPPQFFDRRRLLAAGSPLALALDEGPATERSPLEEPPGAATRRRLAWTALAFLALVVAVVVAVALR